MIRQRKPIKRTPLKRSTTPIRKRRPGKSRRGPVGIPAEEWRNPKYLGFLREHGRCVACFTNCRLEPGRFAPPAIQPCDPAHGPVNGRGSKGPDAGAIPLCRVHHDEQHGSGGWPAFEDKYGFSREREAAIWWKAWQVWKETGL